MTFAELLLIGIGLSMDAFAVAICKGLGMRKFNLRQAGIIALFFGGFQALMPCLGWLLGRQFESYITSIDHWIAFGLLGFIGGKMIIEAIRGGEEESTRFDIKELFVLAVATSIDALAVGITFAFLRVEIVRSAAIIGVTTFIISLAGVAIGHRFGTKLKDKAELLGGIILVLLGIKILLEHLGVINF